MTNALQAENVRQMAQADSYVSFYLAGIESNAQSIARNVRMLPYRRGFETRAEDELEKTRQALIDALQVVQEAQAAYQSLPVEA